MEMFSYAFMQRAFVSALIVGGLCALVGVFVVLKNLSFLGSGIAHSAFGGVAIGYLLGVDPLWTSMVFCLASGLGIAYVAQNSKIKEDTAIGIFFASAMAFGILLLGFTQGYTVDLFGYLFGDILAVTPNDIKLSIVVGGLVLFLVGLFFKEFILIILDPEMGKVEGIPVDSLYYLLITLISLVIAISIRMVGIILVSALLVIPAASARQTAHHIGGVFLLSIIYSLGASLGGLFLSYFFDIPSGATIILLAAGIFFLSLVFTSRR